MFHTGVLHVLDTLDAIADASLSPQARAIAIRSNLATLYAATRRERGEDPIECLEERSPGSGH